MKNESEKAAKRYAGEETRSKAVREFLRSFQLPIIQPVPEIPRHQCVGCYLCVRLNGATGPPLHNEARPFAVTPPHQGDREARSEGRNKKAGSEKEKEGARGRLKNGGGKKKREWERSEGFDGGKRQQQNVAEGAAQMERLPVSKTGRIKEKGLQTVQPKKKKKTPERTQREGAREGERGRGLAPDLGTL